MRNRIISGILAAVLLLGLFAGFAPDAQALHLWIQDRKALKGSDYTKSDVMAQKLDEIFDGNISVWYDSKCTQPVSAPIGSYVMKVGSPMYAGPYGGPSINYGSSCWIYANGVYYTLFKDYVLNNKGQTGNSENIDMSTTATTNCTYANFKAWGVRQGVGAQLRTAGHSMIVLGYDETKLITLEGNVSNGLVCVRERSWDQVQNKYTRFDFIVQPKESYMQEHYDACKHENFSSFGSCAECGFEYNWKRTLDSAAIGSYKVTQACIARSDVPYTASTNYSSAYSPGDFVEVRGSVINAFGETWYQLHLEDGSTAYVPANCLEFDETLSLQVTCTGFKPADQETLEAKSYTLRGTVTSNYPLKQIDAYLDGVWYAKWTASNKNTTTVSLSGTNINYSLAFGKQEIGTHTVKLVATDYAHEGSVTCHESTFYIIPSSVPTDCAHSYAHIDGTNATCTEGGLLTYQCEFCHYTFTEEIPELGHRYENGYCTACGALDVNHTFVYAELTVGTATGSPGSTVSVPVSIEKNPGFAVFSFTPSYDQNVMTFAGVTATPLLDDGTLTTTSSQINWTSEKNVTGDGVLFYLNFNIAENTALGSYPVSLGLRSNSAWYFRDERDNAREINFHSGNIAVQDASQKFDIDVARMILGNALEFQFGVATTKIPVKDGYYAVIEKTWADGTTTEKTIPASAWGVAGPYWAIVYDDLAAKEMADTFYVTIYNAAGEAVSNTRTDSVRDYVARAYGNQSAEGKTMMVDMLCYGAAAQVHFGYGTNDLANSKLTAAQLAVGTAVTPAMENYQLKGTNYSGSRFILESRIQVQLAFKNMTTDMYAIYTYVDATGNAQSVRVESKDFVMINGNPAGVELSKLVYADARALVKVTVYNADGTVHGTAIDSIESCAYRSNGDVFVALMKFADAAKVYLY